MSTPPLCDRPRGELHREFQEAMRQRSAMASEALAAEKEAQRIAKAERQRQLEERGITPPQ